MTQEEYNILVEQSQPHKNFKANWSFYNSSEFRESLLPYTPYKTRRQLTISDGANLLKDFKANRKQLLVNYDNETPSIIYYTYPKTVLAAKTKDLVFPNDNEIICFAEINKNESIDLFFSYGKKLDAFLRDLSFAKNDVYNSTIEKFQKQFNNTFSHEKALSFILNTIGIDNKIINDLDQRKGLSQSLLRYFDSILVNDKFKIRVIPRSSTTQIGIEAGDLDVKPRKFRHLNEIIPEPNEIIIWLLTEDFQTYDTSFIKIKLGNSVARDFKENNISIEYLENIILTQVYLEIDQKAYSNKDIGKALDKGIGNALIALNIKDQIDKDPVLQEVFKKDPFLGLVAIAAKEGAKKLEDYEIGAESWDPKHPNFLQFIPGDSKNNAFICGLINGIIGEVKSAPEMIEFLITVINSETASKEFEASIKKLLEEGIIKTLIEASLKEYADAFKENNFEKLYYNVGHDITQIISLFLSVYQLANSLPKFAKVAKNAILYLQKYGRKGIKNLKKLSKKRKLQTLNDLELEITVKTKKTAQFKQFVEKWKGKSIAKLTTKEIADNLKGFTEQANKIAKLIEERKMIIKIYEDAEFDNFLVDKFGDTLDEARKTAAFNVGNKNYFRASKPVDEFMSEIVHEGTHTLDFIDGFTGDVYQIEKRAFFHERAFQKATEIGVDFEKIEDLLDFIYINY